MWLSGGDQAHDCFLRLAPPNRGMQRTALRAAADANFTHSDNVPKQKLGKWLKWYGPILQLKI